MPALYTRENQLHDRGVNLAVISIVFTFVAVCLVASRLASRLSTGRKLHEDDYAIIASVVCLALIRKRLRPHLDALINTTC